MRTVLCWVVMVAVVTVASGCESNSGSKITLTEANHGEVISARKGDRVEIVLSGNPTTGYTWQVAQLSDAQIEVRDTSYHRSESNLPGAGGVYRFSFRIIERGDAQIRLEYKRPWLDHSDKTFSFFFDIR